MHALRRFARSLAFLCFATSIAFSVAAFAQQPPAADPPAENAAQNPPPAQPAAEPERPKFVIRDEPKTIDPAQFVPPKLAAKATVVFEDASLREVAAWLEKERGIVTLVDPRGLADAALNLDWPIDDRLDDDPVYFLLDRLSKFDLAWYVEDDILRITSREIAAKRLTTRSHNVSDLYDAGYEPQALIAVIVTMVAPDSWSEGGAGDAGIRNLGDILFVSQTEENHRTILGLLAALRTHGRMTFIDEPPQHDRLRQILREKVVTVDFQGTRLEQAMSELATQAGAPILLDEIGLEEAAVTSRTPVTISLAETKLETTLGAILSGLGLDYTLVGGAIVVTSRETAELRVNTAVFDVRDLAIDQRESAALIDALSDTVDPTSWAAYGGTGSAQIQAPVVGTLVVLQTERNLAELASLLKAYREAVDKSKRRKPRDAEDPNEVITVYYRLPKAMADDLRLSLPSMVEPESWSRQPDDGRPGGVRSISSAPDLGVGTNDLAARSTLVVVQTRATHEKIKEAIRRILRGDDPTLFPVGGLGVEFPADASVEPAPEVPAPSGAFGGGGFGGL